MPTAQRAAALRLGVATRQLAAGHLAFRTPDVHSFGGWLGGQSPPAARAMRRLGAGEEWLLWRAAVGAAAAQLGLPMAAGLVDAVRRSAALLFEWRIAPAALAQADTPEAALLGQSLAVIEQQLGELSAAAPWRVLQDLAADPPRRIPVFAGFAAATPARRALYEAWAARGSAVRELRCSFAEAPAVFATAADPAAELDLMAQWCAQRLSTQPAARLLVIVPDLAQRQAEVRRVFDAALDPGYLYRGASGDSVAYALEGGQPLSAYAPIGEALRTLRLLTSEVELAVISQWLRGPFWARPDAGARAQLDVWLRTVAPPRVGCGQLLRALRVAPAALLAHADEIADVLLRLQAALDPGSRAGLGQWSGRFAQVFAICGHSASAPRHRSSHSQQVLQRLDELLRECAAVPPALGLFNAADALAVFMQLLARTRFEPATGDAAVTLTATLADPIARYDGIWVSGLHSGVLPERARFDAFIPAALQRAAGIIAADPAALVIQARQALATLRRSSHEFIVSAPSHAADLELGAAPLLAPYMTRGYAPPRRGAEWSRTLREARQVERYADGPGAAWPDGVPLPAGTRAIELQSRCPFRAYAQLRLGAEPLETPVPGITPRERGHLLHRALELLWRRLGDSSGLDAARAAESLAAMIADCVSQAGAEILRGADADGAQDSSAGPTLAQAADGTGLLALRRAAISRELARAQRLIGALCELEATRAPFAIHELETAHRLRIDSALIDVRIDRVDRLADGTYAILDYKSGRAVTPDWDLARTTHPQLLVYLLAAGVPVSTLAVAHLDPKAVVFKGIGDADARLPGLKGVAAPAAPAAAAGEVPGPWARQLQVWHDQVRQLAGDFMRGEARVDPMDKACDYCHLHAFCRIADRDTAARIDAAEQPDE